MPFRTAFSGARRRLLSSRRALLTTIAAVLVAAGVGATTLGALGAFNAVITQNGTFTAGSIVLKETGTVGSGTCYSTGGTNTPFTSNSYTCTTIDTFGGPTLQEPGGSANTQTLAFTNVGTSAASTFTGSAASCSAAGTGSYYGNDTSGFCGKVDVTIGNGASVCYYPSQASACPALSNTYTLATLASTWTSGSPFSFGSLAAGASDTVVVKTQLDSTATNADQGLEATQAFTWTLNQ
jgi:hypothetical protein